MNARVTTNGTNATTTPKAALTFKRSKETAGCWVFSEETPELTPPKVGTLYVKKWVTGSTPPERITATLNW